MNPCPQCHSNQVFQYRKEVDAESGLRLDLLPKLAPHILATAKLRPTVCVECGLIRLYASKDARSRLGSSNHWELIES